MWSGRINRGCEVIDKLMQMGDGRLLIPLIVVAVAVVLVKGGFSLARSRSVDRRDFLELFQKDQGENDLWLSVAIRHLYGAHLPTSLIRQLMSAPQPGRALLEVANSWELLDMDDETGSLHWRRKLFSSAKARRNIIWLMYTFYFGLAATSLVLGYRAITRDLEGLNLWVTWAYSILCAFGAFASLVYGDTLKDASKAAQRWLGMP